MTSLIAELRRRGHQVKLDGLRVVLLLAAGANRPKAETWARQHESQLRAELVAEAHAACGMVRETFDGAGRVREVRAPGGAPIRGAVQVIEAADFEVVA